MMCTSRMPSDPANIRCVAEVTSGKASPGAVAYSWSPTRATVVTVPTAGSPLNHGAESERLIVKIPPTALQFHVPSPLLAAGSVSGPGQPSGPPTWLHDIAASRPVFSAAVENDCVDAASVVSVM